KSLTVAMAVPPTSAAGAFRPGVPLPRQRRPPGRVPRQRVSFGRGMDSRARRRHTGSKARGRSRPLGHRLAPGRSEEVNRTQQLVAAVAVGAFVHGSAAAEELTIGMITTLSGPGAGLGIDIRDAFNLA